MQNISALIIKPTEKCNFRCTFCSSTSIADSKTDVLDLELVFDFLKRFPKTETIIVNGGDPLMMPVDYYERILDYLEINNLKTILSFTSNLWAFYKNPNKWAPIFRRKNVGVITSFNYGDTRVKGNLQPFREDEFWDVSNKFLDYVGYRPDFISVITDENIDLAIKNVELAYEMSDGKKPQYINGEKIGVVCNLNPGMASGKHVVDMKTGHKMGLEGNPFMLARIYEKYVEIAERSLDPWEQNTTYMRSRLSNLSTPCPQNRECDSGIRALNPNGKYYSCGAFSDDGQYPVDYELEVKNGGFDPVLQRQPELFSLKEECLTCPLFKICNGCRKTILDMKKANMVEEHCGKMKALRTKIQNYQIL